MLADLLKLGQSGGSIDESATPKFNIPSLKVPSAAICSSSPYFRAIREATDNSCSILRVVTLSGCVCVCFSGRAVVALPPRRYGSRFRRTWSG